MLPISNELKAAYIEGLVTGVSRGSVDAVIADKAWQASRAYEQSRTLPQSTLSEGVVEALANARDAIRCSIHCGARIGSDCDCGAERIRQEADAALSATPKVDERQAVEAETYRQMHETARELGYDDILDALEALPPKNPVVDSLDEVAREIPRLRELAILMRRGHRFTEGKSHAFWIERLADNLAALRQSSEGQQLPGVDENGE